MFWAVALEKYGMPTAAGVMPAGASAEDEKLFLESLLQIHGNGAVTFPEGFKYELLQSLRTSGGDFEKFQQHWDRAISKIILSQTMTTDAHDNGDLLNLRVPHQQCVGLFQCVMESEHIHVNRLDFLTLKSSA